jgi:Zn-dependent protease with chaperone function
MSPAILLCLVLLATYALVGLLLSAVLALVWQAGLSRVTLSSLDLLSLRLLPAAGALLIALTVALPAFLWYEPHREREPAGPLLIALAAFAVACFAHGAWRAWRACGRARALLRRARLHEQHSVHGPALQVVEVAHPFIAVIGAWRPCIVTTESIRAACNPDEFQQVLAHETAHVATHDNLKLLLVVAAPDALAWTPLAKNLLARWQTAAERDADERATGSDPRRRLSLASALIKVARLVTNHERAFTFSMPVATDDVPGRVRRLLGPPAQPLRAVILRILTSCGLLIPLVALPRYAMLHELIEQLVSLGH